MKSWFKKYSDFNFYFIGKTLLIKILLFCTGLINYNFLCFRNAILEVFEIGNKQFETNQVPNSHLEEVPEEVETQQTNNLQLQLGVSPALCNNSLVYCNHTTEKEVKT